MAPTLTIPRETRNPSIMLKSLRPVLLGWLIAWLGAMPASAQEGITLRNRLHIVSTVSARGVTDTLVEAFINRYAEVQPPRMEMMGSAAALERFCAGVGPNTPDIAVSTRRISRAQLNECQSNGVSDVVEVQLGQGAVVIATRRGDSIAGLTTRQIYTALAADLAQNEEFIDNTLNTWSRVGANLPETPIRAILPDRTNGTRALFNDFVMEGGCRDVKAVRLIFLASIRVPKCTTLRHDGRVRETSVAEVPAALLDSPPGTIAAISYAQLLESGGNLVPVALNGVLPSATTVASGEYELTRILYLYAKRQHARSIQGVGVVRGVREFVIDSVSEANGGPGGALTAIGLVPFPAARRAAQRSIAERLALISR